MFKFNLGARVKDIVTSFEGVITGRTEFLNGCKRYGVQSDKLSKDGEPMAAQYFDEEQLVLEGTGIDMAQRQTGGDRPAPRRAPDVPRC